MIRPICSVLKRDDRRRRVSLRPDTAQLGPWVPWSPMFPHILSRPVDFSKWPAVWRRPEEHRPAGLTIVIVRDDLIGRAHRHPIFDYRLVADHGSMYNTPPTYSIYVAGLVFSG